MRDGRRSVVGCTARFTPALTCVAMAVAGCAMPDDASGRSDATQEITVVVAPEELEVSFDYCQALGDPGPPGSVCSAVDLRFVYCSASLACNNSFLHDPLTLERGFTLETGFSCRFPPATPQDALLAYHPEVRCYQSGDPGDRTTWQPAAGILVTPQDGEHMYFSSEGAAQGDVYTNAALLMRPLKSASADGVGGHGFCELSAWGTIAFANMTDGGGIRRAEHVPRSPAVVWHAIVEWTGSDWDCHLGEPTLSSVQRVVLTSATHDQPLPLNRIELPASHGVILVREEPLVGVAGIDPAHPQVAAKLRFNETSWFPVEPDDVPEPMSERQLWVMSPSSPGVPANIRVEKSCAEIDASGVRAIGLLVSDSDHIGLGAIIVWPLTIDGDAWDCDRDGLNGDCRLWAESEWDDLVPCLLPGAP